MLKEKLKVVCVCLFACVDVDVKASTPDTACVWRCVFFSVSAFTVCVSEASILLMFSGSLSRLLSMA